MYALHLGGVVKVARPVKSLIDVLRLRGGGEEKGGRVEYFVYMAKRQLISGKFVIGRAPSQALSLPTIEGIFM